MFAKFHKPEDSQRPIEDVDDPANYNFLKDVNALIQILESKEYELKKQIKALDSMLKADTKSIKTKTMMCPLGEECQEDIRPRWPTSNIKTISTFGHKCQFAHHTYELKFKQEVKARKQILENMITRLKQQFHADPKKPAFNPGGAVFSECIGCGEGSQDKEDGRIKGISKGLCSMCQLRKGVAARLEVYTEKANDRKIAITTRKDFLTKYYDKLDFEEKLKKKLGYYRKALVLYNSGKRLGRRRRVKYKTIFKAYLEYYFQHI